MTKRSDNTARKRPFTPRVTPIRERVDATVGPFEFPVEAEPKPPTLVRHPTIVPISRTPALPPPAAPISHSSRRLLWLVAVLAACAPLAWIALRSSAPAVPQRAAAPIAVPASQPQPQPQLVLASAAPAPAPPQTPSTVEPTRARPRDDASARERRMRRAEAPAPVAQAAAPAAAGFHGSLVVESEPAGARVFVNGAAAGSTPLVLENVPVGSRVVRVEAEAYAPWSSAVRVVANEQTHISAKLRP